MGAKRTNVTGISNKLDYEGREFGNLTVIEYINAKEVVCRCNCSKHTIITTRKYKLDNGSVSSCGCQSEHTLNKNKYELIETDEYIVLKYINALKIICMCSCGNVFTTTKTHIDNNEVHSCGCRHHVINYDMKYKLDHKGHLEIGRHIGYGVYECTCTCGNICYRSKQQLDVIDNPSCGCKQGAPRGRTQANLELLGSIYNYILNNHNKTLQEIADALGLSYSTIQKAVHTLNIEDSVTYNDSTSHCEKELRSFIEELNVKTAYNSRTIIAPLELDVYIPEKKIAIEFNGNYWHSDKYLDKYYHKDKTFNCAQKNIRLIHIFEYEWTDERKRGIIKNIIARSIGSNNKKIYARDTVITEVDNKTYKEFCDDHHLQGYSNAETILGCYYNNELLGIISFGKPRFNSGYQYELIRLCWKDAITVIGGTEKLFTYFKNKYKPDSIITYTNIAKFTGNIYLKLGFKLCEVTEPNYVWTKNKFNETLSRYQTQKHKLIEQGLGTENQTEDEIMKSLGYLKVYDCGNLKLEWIHK